MYDCDHHYFKQFYFFKDVQALVLLKQKVSQMDELYGQVFCKYLGITKRDNDFFILE